MPPAANTLTELWGTAKKYGLGTVLALFLVYKLAFAYEDKLDLVAAKLDVQAERDAVQILLLRAICEHTAPTDASRLLCREVGR